MITDERAFDGWRRLRVKVMELAASDDPAAIVAVMEELADAQAELAEAAAALTGRANKWGVVHDRPYSQGELARELGISRPAVTKWLAKVGR